VVELLSITMVLILGCFAGIITGLLPGIHTNTVAALVLASLSVLLHYFSPLSLGIFLTSMVVVHSFVDFIPTIFLGAPEAETALGVLPGHKMLLEGQGYKALKLTVMGGLGSFAMGLFLQPMFMFAVKNGYYLLEKIILPLLILTSAYFILTEKSFSNKSWALLIFLLSGVLGIVCLESLPLKEPLFPLLSGLFGISTLIVSMSANSKIPEQIIDEDVKILDWKNFINYIKSILSSSIMSVLPALGSAQATILAQSFTKEKDHESFLVIVGGINTASALFVLTTLFAIDRARTGVIAVMKNVLTLDLQSYLYLVIVSIIAAVIGAILTLQLGKFLANKISKINYRKTSIIIIAFIAILVFIISGFMGLLVLSVSTAIGLLAPLSGARRIHAMGVLVIPIILYFI